ncbi:hypothetical protein BZA05DRAFT_410465 [Tricharina praecox]|uniref:uncharacterized protein n=1 Tax=Tricharina praecox TaxID=43433 RepID=UPI002220C364|nr:uncharacterized protein BZA05DRAFT_410465 [Tricharina praecox]KAI5843724.1 hypothetical protein BZA05DRAFT_410465 [Tricharina praecox]
MTDSDIHPGAAAYTPPSSYADIILSPPSTPRSVDRFAFNSFLRKEYRFGLDPTRKTCPLFLQGHCPLGNSCLDKHFLSTNNSSSSFNNLVCKHWLRSLCKKGEGCEFLHEYNLRKMPECNFFVRNGYCSNGEECLYLHVDPESRIPRCQRYDNGFCELGPKCARKHVRRPLMCKFFLAGFCPDGSTVAGAVGGGKGCKEGAHPKWVSPATLPLPTVKRPREEPEERGPPAWEEGGRFGGGGGSGGGSGRGGFQGGGQGRRRFFRGRG